MDLVLETVLLQGEPIGTLPVQRGTHVWVNEVGEQHAHAEWAWGQLWQADVFIWFFFFFNV